MATRKKTKAVKTKAKPPRPPRPPRVDPRTDERRDRVLQLWGKKDSLIAKILLEEGFEVDCGEQPITREKRAEWEVKRRDSMRRNVANDRVFWDEKFREMAKQPKSSEDAAVERARYIASLRTDIDDIEDLIVDRETKSSAKSMLYRVKVQARELIGKAQGVDTLAPVDPEDGKPKPRVVGVIFDTSELSDEDKAELREQGYAIP